jgi:hypothetical protein
MRDITNINNKRELHGYNARYTNKCEIMSRGNYKNHKHIGYDEGHNHWHYPKKTTFYIR